MERQSRFAFSPLSSMSVLFNFLFSMLTSSLLLDNPLIGGGMYLLGRTVTVYGRWLHPLHFYQLSRRRKRIALGILLTVFVSATLLSSAFPVRIDSTVFWLIVTITFLGTIRPLVTQAMIERFTARGLRPFKAFVRLVFVQLALLILPTMLIFLTVLPPQSWMLLVGYLVGTAWEAMELWRARYYRSDPENADADEVRALINVHAWKTFCNLLFVVTAAVQATLIMAYTFISCTAGEMLLCIGVAVVGTSVAYFLTSLLLKLVGARKRDPSNLLFLGIVLWIAGLTLFSNNILRQSLVSAYLSLALSTMGIGVCVRVLIYMEHVIRNVAAFSLGSEPTQAYDRFLRFEVDFASLAGQLIALLGIALFCFFNKDSFPNTLDELAAGIRPLMLVPAMLLAFAALVCALLFPMTKQHMQKLDRYITLENQGDDNPALRAQLEGVIVRRSLKHYGVKLIMLVLRPFLFHRIRGKENVPNDPERSMVFVCNHGEIYGPIVTNLYVPFSFRPWVISEMMDVNAIAERCAEGTFKLWKWMPDRWRLPIAKAVAPFMAWVMRSVDAIPVYYQEPAKLRQTFRESISAMEAGDNILLFPENSDDTPDHHYKLSGVSHFFTGFTMLGPMYYRKTGKRAIFVPIYADKKRRVLTFGVPTEYDPDNDPEAERDRLCEYLRGEMLKSAGNGDEE